MREVRAWGKVQSDLLDSKIADRSPVIEYRMTTTPTMAMLSPRDRDESTTPTIVESRAAVATTQRLNATTRFMGAPSRFYSPHGDSAERCGHRRAAPKNRFRRISIYAYLGNSVKGADG
jgi:hypothetical protein